MAEVLASVLKDDVRWDALPATTPVRITRLIGRCLERDPKQRLRDIGDARIEIADAERELAQGPSVASGERAPAPVAAPVPVRSRTWPWIDRAAPGKKPLDVIGEPGEYGTFRLSPDGSRIVTMRDRPAGGSDVWLPALGRGTTSKLTSDSSTRVYPI